MSETTPAPTDAVESAVTPPFDPERIITDFDAAFERLPEAAMREAREHREVMTPLLIQAIRDATSKVRAGEKVEGNAHFFALFLLSEFGAREAMPTILEAISLPGEGPFDLFEDAITSILAGILVTLPDDPLPLIEGLIRNGDLNEYVRWEAAQAYAHLVRRGKLTREQAVELLRQHLRRELEKKDESLIVSALICTLSELAPKEAYDDIKEAFSQGIVDESMIDMGSIDRAIAEGEAGVQRNLEHLREFDDAIEELGHWASFQPQPATRPEPWSIRYDESPSVPPGRALPPEPPARLPALKPAAGKRVGRNDPCPCGSGKKYKKCCMDKDRNG